MNKIKRQEIAWEKIFTKQLADRGLLSRMCIITTEQVEKDIEPKGKKAKDMNYEFTEEEIRIGNACMQTYSTSYTIREVQLKQ